MAKCELTLHVRVVSVGGTAVCDVCTLFFAWKYPFDDELDERLEQLVCPHCRGSVQVDERSLMPEIEITGPRGTETVLAMVGEGGDG